MMKLFQTVYQEQIRHIIPGILVVAIITVAVFSTLAQYKGYDGPDTVNADSSSALTNKKGAVKKAKKDDSASGNEGTNQEEVTFEDGDYSDGVFTGSAIAYRGNLDVAVTIKTGKIKKIVITKTQDDSEYLAMCKNVIPSIIKKQSPNVDTVSGATYSSKGIINATKKALNKARKDSSKNEDVPENENENTGPNIPSPDEDSEEIVPLEIKYINGTYNGSALGYHSWFEIQVRVQVEDNSISTIDITDHLEDDEYMDPVVDYLLPRIVKRQGTDGIDTISGATWSSQGILDAVDDALKDAVLTD